jgi:hypothetical protein
LGKKKIRSVRYKKGSWEIGREMIEFGTGEIEVVKRVHHNKRE